jgi:hypothetical protein
MDVDAFTEEFHQRCWLLAKALESAPLDKALETARAADKFLRGEVPVVAAAAPIMVAPEPRLLPVADPSPVIDVPVAEPEPHPVELEDLVAPEPQMVTGPDTSDLIEDVVRYLRQRDDTVVRTQENLFLVNGRFRMTTAELVSRANRMRERHQKPAFQLRPSLGGASAAVS